MNSCTWISPIAHLGLDAWRVDLAIPTVDAPSCRYAATGSAAPCAISGRTPERRRLPVMSAPAAKIAAAHQNAVVYPSTAACRTSCGPFVARESVVAATAIVLSSAVPIEPPTCWDV